MRQQRFTSLDRIIARNARHLVRWFILTLDSDCRSASAGVRWLASIAVEIRDRQAAVLEHMGLAKATGPNTWNVARTSKACCEPCNAQRIGREVLAAHGVVVSDERLTIEVTVDFSRTDSVEEESCCMAKTSSRAADISCWRAPTRAFTSSTTQPKWKKRSRGELRPNAFARFRRTFIGRGPAVEIEDLGDSEALVNSHGRLEATARR